ncbi:hypothetical protein [Ancylobacter oerskovii]|uniref:SMODS and SLOG-associating 2TM effector domain-containing protein n=1 Tax=Ancylobacter oerskovii TaxID=459519 RepID=A0ABW4Z127_9HYPH|nr:hypothetical protein [Ancylobacter oerskovii]MBS7545117.1 hypothetical protein [Ancylobacter oerskovii]
MDALFEVAIEDARERRNAVIDLIKSQDQQAIALLTGYCTLSVACASGAVAAFTFNSPSANYFLSAMLGAFCALMLGNMFCYLVLKSSDVVLPGREAGFWKWAAENNVGQSEVLAQYLASYHETDAENDAVNQACSKWLQWARMSGIVAAPAASIAALAFGGLAWLFGL